jgi:hypothetical protein
MRSNPRALGCLDSKPRWFGDRITLYGFRASFTAMINADEEGLMPTTRKPRKGIKARKPVASAAGRVLATPKKSAAASPKQGAYQAIGQRQLKEADEMLVRIERKGEALSASADLLLRRVS